MAIRRSEADFKTLNAYSPYHNIRAGMDYPAVLVTTADTDDRVVPGHSFKYTAALQAADVGAKPHLIRIETRAGHGSGKPTDKIIEEYADMWAFIARHTGMTRGKISRAVLRSRRPEDPPLLYERQATGRFSHASWPPR